jgi:hypothetical protein
MCDSCVRIAIRHARTDPRLTANRSLDAFRAVIMSDSLYYTKEQAELSHGLRSRPVLTGSMPRAVAYIRTAIAASLAISRPGSRAANAPGV